MSEETDNEEKKYSNSFDFGTSEFEVEYRGDVAWFEVQPIKSKYHHKFLKESRKKDGDVDWAEYNKKYIEKSVVDTSIENFTQMLNSAEDNIPPHALMTKLKNKIEEAVGFTSTEEAESKKMK